MRKKLLIATTKGLSVFSNHHNFTPKPQHLSFEMCYSVDPLNVQRRGWAYAASVPSEAPDAQKGRKRVPKHERRAMVESFVNKYRAENHGKFPKASDTRKQIGGSFYVVREIIQELEYKSKMNSSKSMDENLAEKQFDERKLLTIESLNASSVNIEIAKDRPIQDDSQLVVIDDKETVNTGYEHLEGKRGPQTSHSERRSSEEAEIISAPSNHCIASESNIVENVSMESYSYPSSLHRPNDIENEEAVSSYSDSVGPESQLLQNEREHFSPSFGENHGTGYGKAQGQEYDFVDMKNHLKMEENVIKKAGYERREQPELEDLSRELSHSSLQVPNDVKSGKTISSSSDYITEERHLLKEEIERAPSIETSGSSCSNSQSHDSKFVDMENYPTIEKQNCEKAGYERKEQDALKDPPEVDGPKHKIEQSQRSSELDESKTDSSNNRKINVTLGSEKSTLWGNLKSFASGILNFWRKS